MCFVFLFVQLFFCLGEFYLVVEVMDMAFVKVVEELHLPFLFYMYGTATLALFCVAIDTRSLVCVGDVRMFKTRGI